MVLRSQGFDCYHIPVTLYIHVSLYQPVGRDGISVYEHGVGLKPDVRIDFHASLHQTTQYLKFH